MKLQRLGNTENCLTYIYFLEEILKKDYNNEELKSINNHAMKLISEHYTYHFTGYPGCNINPRLPLHIQRINIETHWTIEMVKFALTNIDWLRWRKEQKLFVSNNLSLFHENY